MFKPNGFTQPGPIIGDYIYFSYNQTLRRARIFKQVETTVLDPSPFCLDAPYPNPFNSSTTLHYEIPTNTQVKLTIYDVLGRRIVVIDQGTRSAGSHEAIWNGTDEEGMPVGNGVYIFRFQAGEYTGCGKALLLK